MSIDTRPRRGAARLPEDFRPMVGRAPGRTLPAGKAILVVLIALVTATLLNSRAMVRAGENMHPGLTRDLTLAAARPADALARHTGLTLPRRGLDAVFGHRPKTAGSGGGLEHAAQQVTLPPAPVDPVPAPVASGATRGAAAPALGWRHPTPSRPLHVLVTGDSLSDYVGAQLANLTAAGRLATVTTLARDGTGLTNPSFFDWQVNARQEVTSRHPGAVVMIIGGNDGWNLMHGRHLYGADTDQWQLEYAKRVAVVMRTLSEGGRRPVYWSGPPTSRDPKWNRIFARQNRAIAQAAAAVPGVRYVDLYSGTSVDGRYADYVPVDGHLVKARQADGIHWSYDGARQPAQLVLAALTADFGRLS